MNEATGIRMGDAGGAKPTRRDFLRAGAFAASAAALSPFAGRTALGFAPGGPSNGKTKHVVVIAFAGGVRSKETIGTPQNVPSLMRIANQGCVFPNVKAFGLKSSEIQSRLLQEAGLACLAGTAFGAHGEGYLRFSYATSMETIEEGVRRVRGLLEKLPRR